MYYYIMYILSGTSFHIIAISFFVYIFVNLFENMIHYNIGRFSHGIHSRETKFELPNQKEFIKIVVVMMLFALLQGLLTSYFNKSTFMSTFKKS